MKKFLTLCSTAILSLTSLSGSMEYFKGDGEELKIEQAGEIQLLTWNILGLPAQYCATRPWEERIDGMVDLIRSENPDLLLLQESFEKGLSEALFERLKDIYPHAYLHLKADSYKMPSGLALFSKLPIADFHFTPHPNLLDDQKLYLEMGTCDFVLLNQEGKPAAHIAASHFLGPSRCEWRKGLTDQGEKLSYEDVRQGQAESALNLFAPVGIPRYLCGDLNIERNSAEFITSLLNPEVNSSINDGLTKEQRVQPTNTSYFQHLKNLGAQFPELSGQEILDLMKVYKELSLEHLLPLLKKDPWNKPLSEFDPLLFHQLEEQLDLSTKERQMAWNYFTDQAAKALAHEIDLWKKNGNYGDVPPVFMGDLLEVLVLPFYEALDTILALNEYSKVENVEIVKAYDETDPSLTLSDHHPYKATIRIAIPD